MPPKVYAIDQYFLALSGILSNSKANGLDGMPLLLPEALTTAVEFVKTLKPTGHKAMIIGNGGSAALASHFQNDLCKAANIRATVFTEQALLTAFSNDESYECAYERHVQLWGQKGDILIAISSSGRSKNILRAVETAKSLGSLVVTLSGFSPDNPLRKMGNINLYVSSSSYGLVELAHAVLLHFISDCAAGNFNEEQE